jgi:regulatory protein
MPSRRRPPDALEAGLRALRARDHTAASLGARLDRRGVGDAEARAAVERLRELGYVDDQRFAERRAGTLAERGAGNLLIAADLEGHGVGAALVASAIESLPPESERARAVVARRGPTLQTARHLLARGFDEDVVAGVVAAAGGEPLG